MTYQPGTYAPSAIQKKTPPNEEVADLARYLQRYVDEHERGEHDAAPNLHCCECARKLGERL